MIGIKSRIRQRSKSYRRAFFDTRWWETLNTYVVFECGVRAQSAGTIVISRTQYHCITHSCHCTLKNYEYLSYYSLLSSNVTKTRTPTLEHRYDDLIFSFCSNGKRYSEREFRARALSVRLSTITHLSQTSRGLEVCHRCVPLRNV